MKQSSLISLFLFLSLSICLPKLSLAQFYFDFESPETSTPIEGFEAAIVDNPDTIGNVSAKTAFYNRPAGNWHFFALPFEEGLNIGDNDRVSFKVRTSTSGRIFIKFWDGNEIALESWVREYDYRPTPNTWTELSYDISALKNQNITRLEIAASVDNNDAAEVYYDDFKLFNSASPNGEPIIALADFSKNIELGTLLVLDASRSMDIGGTITNYHWEMGDGTIYEGTDSITHLYLGTGFYQVVLSLTDNEGNTSQNTYQIWVYESGIDFSPFFINTPTLLTNDKIELGFLITKNYNNPFDVEEVEINALITYPNGQTKKVPCFFYQEVNHVDGRWLVKESENYWMLRWSSEQNGMHQVQLESTDTAGTQLGIVQTFTLSEGTAKGIIQKNPTQPQYYQHTTGESYYPFGINAGWDVIDNYATLTQNLSAGKANWMRYWHAAFTNQALEWKEGLGMYSAIAGAKQDSILALCKENDLFLQMCIFHHGMFSHTINSNWSNSPYNQRNGGMLTKGEDFFYNEVAKKQAKKLLRYIVARWGYAPELFAWELFNEVQWTGNHPNQSDQWKTAVIEWHDEMGKYLKELDAFDHLVTTSADDNQLNELADKTGIDVIQYHTYPGNNLVNDLITKDAQFLSEQTEAAIICGEYGYNGDGDVPFDEQRLAIWTSIFSRVPHMIWRWQVHYETEWTDLFRAPATFVQEENIADYENLSDWYFSARGGSNILKTVGFTQDNQQAYGLVYEQNLKDDISNATINLSRLKFGNYNIETTDITTGEKMIEESVAVTFLTTAHDLPIFSDALIVKASFQEPLQILLAFAGFDQAIGLGQPADLIAQGSLQPTNAAVIYQWSIFEQPDSSNLLIPSADSLNTSIIPDVAGNYQFVFTITNLDNEQTSTDTLDIFVSDNPVAIAGADISIDLGERPTISGRESFDPESDRITYDWSMVTQPIESTAELKFTTSSRPILDPDVTGIYAIELVVSDGYSESSPDTVLVNVGLSTSIASIEESSTSINLFPNPTNDILNIQIKSPSLYRTATCTIVDLMGKVLNTQQLDFYSSQIISLSLDELGMVDGMYMLQLSTEEDMVHMPFIVQRRY